MPQAKSGYVLESSTETERLDRQARMKAYDFSDELRFLDIFQGQKILDAGCGSGIVSDYLSKRAPGVEVVGWDFSKDRIAEAQARYGANKNVRFAQMNLLEMDAPGACVDAVVCRYVLRHFSSDNGKKVMQNLCGVLRPGGTLYCIDVEGVLADVFPASAFLKKALAQLRDAKTVDFHVARKLPSLMIEQGLLDVDWRVLVSEFRGDERSQEIDNLEQAIVNAEAFAKKVLGGARAFNRFKKEYFGALREQSSLALYYNRVVAIGRKPGARPQLVR